MSPASIDPKNLRVLFLGPRGGDTHTNDFEPQGRAARSVGAEFVVYDGESDGELIEALKPRIFTRDVFRDGR